VPLDLALARAEQGTVKNIREPAPDYVPPRTLWIKLSAEQADHLAACARARDISMTELVKRLVDVITKDSLVTSILDDDCGGASARR
jgi:hypothetical protein